MGKHINTSWQVVVNNVDLSDHAFNVQIADEKERVDVSGFSATKTREYLPGVRDQSVTVSFIQDEQGTASVDATILTLYQSGTVFPFFVKRDSTAGTDQYNKIYGGTASVYSYPASGELNAREEVEIVFLPATNTAFEWGTIAPS